MLDAILCEEETSVIEEKIIELRASIPTVEPASDRIDVRYLLSALLHEDIWSEHDQKAFVVLLRKVDITKQLKTHYRNDWKRLKEASALTEPWFSITALLLCKLFAQEKDNGAAPCNLLKRMNTLLKLLDMAVEPWLSIGSPIRDVIENDLRDLVANAPYNQPNSSVMSDVSIPKSSNTKTTIPLTVLYWEGPIARAYLETIHSLGFAPEKIIRLVSSHDIATGKPVARWLPNVMRSKYAANLQEAKIHHWPKQISKANPILQKAILDEVCTNLGFTHATLSGANELRNLSYYCDDVETLLVDSLRDPALEARLTQLSSVVLLYTGGGILPPNLLSIPQLRFIHIHPGFLPDIRGADCVLWSSLIADRASATCFYMSPGIDTGDIILPCWLPKVRFDVGIDTLDIKTLYRAVFCFFDPWVRSYVLRLVLSKFREFDTIPSTQQDPSDGITYHFMHASLQKYSFQSLFKRN